MPYVSTHPSQPYYMPPDGMNQSGGYPPASSGQYPSMPVNSRNAPTVRALHRLQQGPLQDIINHPYFGVGLVVVIAMVLIMMALVIVR